MGKYFYSCLFVYFYFYFASLPFIFLDVRMVRACVCELMYRWYHTVDTSCLSRSWWDVFRSSVFSSWLIRLILPSCAMHDSCGLKNSAQQHGSLSFRYYIIWHSLRLLSFLNWFLCGLWNETRTKPSRRQVLCEKRDRTTQTLKTFLYLCTLLLFIYRRRRHCVKWWNHFLLFNSLNAKTTCGRFFVYCKQRME